MSAYFRWSWWRLGCHAVEHFPETGDVLTRTDDCRSLPRRLAGIVSDARTPSRVTGHPEVSA